MSASRTATMAGAVGALTLVFAAGAVAKTLAGVVPDIPTAKRLSRLARIPNLPYRGGPVMHSNRTHLIFWLPAGSGLSYDPGYQAQVETFLSRVGQDSHRPTNVYALSGQYSDQAGAAAYDSTYAGAVLDTGPLPQNDCAEPLPPPLGTGPGWNICLTDSQLEGEISGVVNAAHLPRTLRDIYFLVTPYGLGNCNDVSSTSCALGGMPNGYCGYHSSDPDGTLLYAVIPYNAVAGHCESTRPRPNASSADPALSSISHEHNEMVTDPVTFDPAWIDMNGEEDGDLCAGAYGPTVGGAGAGAWNQVIAGGHYFLQEEYSNDDGSCRPQPAPDWVWFAPPRQVPARRPITFTAHARAAHGSISFYDWFFGEPPTGHSRAVTHTFTRPGAYRIVLRVTNSAENWTYAVRTLRVTKPRANSGHQRRR